MGRSASLPTWAAVLGAAAFVGALVLGYCRWRAPETDELPVRPPAAALEMRPSPKAVTGHGTDGSRTALTPAVAEEAGSTAPEFAAPIRCRVHAIQERPDESFEELRVEICSRASAGEPWRVIASGDTDASGRFETDVRPLAPAQEDEPPALLARLAEDGWIRSERALRQYANASERSVRLDATRGVSFRGRLVDGSGEGLPGEVKLVKRIGGARMGGGNTARAKEDGRFLMHAQDHWFGAQELDNLPVLIGFAPGKGTKAIRAFSVDPAALEALEPEGVEIVVEGRGVLSGRVLDAAGSPVVGLRVLARASSEGDYRMEAIHVEKYAEGSGHLSADGFTGTDGRFKFTGLKEGGYWVHGAEEASRLRSGKTAALAPLPLTADGSEHALRHSSPTLRVDLLGSLGESWAAGLHGAHMVPPREFGPDLMSFPVRPVVLVRPMGEVHSIPSRWHTDSSLYFPTRGHTHFELVVLGGASGGDGFLFQRKEVGPRDADPSGSYRVSFTATRLPTFGTLRLDGTVVSREPLGLIERVDHLNQWTKGPALGFKGAFEQPLPKVIPEEPKPLAELPSHEIVIRHDASGEVVASFGFVPTLLLEGISVPPGTYRTTIRPVPKAGLPGRTAGGAESIDSVSPGQVATAYLAVGPGSTLRPYVEGETGTHVRLHLEDQGGKSTQLQWIDGQNLANRWPVRGAIPSCVVPSGEYTLVVTGQDGRVTRLPVTLKPGENTDIRVR